MQPVAVFSNLTLQTGHGVVTTETRWKVLWVSTNPLESVFVANTWQHVPHLLFCGPLVSNLPTEPFCKQSLVYGVSDRYFHIPLPIVTKHELGFPFPLGTFAWNLVQIRPQFFSYRGHRQTHRHTDKPTPLNTYTLAFAGIMMVWLKECFKK